MRRPLALLLAVLFLVTTLRGDAAGSSHCAPQAGVHQAEHGASSHHGHDAGAGVRLQQPAQHECPHCPATTCHSMTSCGGLSGGVVATTLSPASVAAGRKRPAVGATSLLSRSIQPTQPPPRVA